MSWSQHYQTTLIFLEQWGISESQLLAYGSTLLISIAPFLILFLCRFENKPQHRNKLRLALSFACGGLLGDSFLHLIPHSMGHHEHGHEHGHHEHGHHEHDHHHHHEHSHHHEHDHDHVHEHHHEEEHHHDHGHQTIIGLYIVIGIVLFFAIEKLVHILKGESHSHGVHEKIKEKVTDSDSDYDDDVIEQTKKNKKYRKHVKKSPVKSNPVSHSKLVSGILNLIADFLHNFTDGLAIGATFAAGKGMGTITAVTILLHEIPHEIGDYAILIQAGYKRRSAISLQLVTAIGALIGTAVGLHYGTLEDATQFILPITAGGFIYIATVSIMPSLQEKSSSLQSLCEMFSIFTGIGMMYWIALNE